MAPEGSARRSADNQVDTGHRPLGSIPSFVWLTAAATFALLLLGTLLLPQLRIPDEKHHADMALMALEGTWIVEGWPAIGERRLDPAIVDASLSLGRREAALRENRAAQHPPLFYLLAAGTASLTTAPVETPSLALQIWSFRLVSVLATAVLPVVVYLIAAELTTNCWVRLASAVVPLMIPGITLRDGPMVNTDALLTLLTALSVLFSIRVAKGDLGKRTGILLGLATGLAAITKGHALVVIPVIVAAYLIRLMRDRRITRGWIHSVALAGGISLVVGGWWWVRNLVLHGAVQPVRHLQPVTEPIVFDWFAFDWMAWITEALPRMVGSFWGGQFALSGRSNMELFWALTALFALGCVVGWMRSRDRTASSISAMYAVLLIPAVLLTSAFLSSERGRVVGVHGRYFFPGIAGTAPLAVMALAGITRRATRWLPTVIVAGATAMTLLATRYMLVRYWSASGSAWDDRWSAVMGFSPFPSAVETGILVLAVALFFALIVSAIRMGLRHD